MGSPRAAIEKHGTSTAYVNHKCRCEECRAWQRNRRRGQRATEQARQQWSVEWEPDAIEDYTTEAEPVEESWAALAQAVTTQRVSGVPPIPMPAEVAPYLRARPRQIVEARAWVTQRRGPELAVWVQLHCGHGFPASPSEAFGDTYPCGRCRRRVTRYTTSPEAPEQRWPAFFTAPPTTTPQPEGRPSTGLAIVQAGSGCSRHTTAIGSEAAGSGFLWCEVCGEVDGWVPYSGASQGASPPPGTVRAYVMEADPAPDLVPA